MNHELEKLLDLTLVDGYISDKEREVLKRKAQKLGLAEGEADIYIDAKLHEINLKNGTAKEEIKCPACGQVVTTNDNVCPSCDYELEIVKNEKSQLDSSPNIDLKYSGEINKDISNYEKALKEGSLINIWRAIKIIFTGGLYIVYKKVILGGVIFDGFEKESTALITKAKIYQTYLESKKVDSAYTTDSLNNARKVVRNQRMSKIAPTFLWLLLLFGIPYGWFYLMMRADEKAAIPVIKHTNNQGVSNDEKLYSFATIDSLISNDNYSQAADAAITIPETEYDEHIDFLVVKALQNKEFERAKKLSEIMKNGKVAQKRIRLAEMIQNHNPKSIQ